VEFLSLKEIQRQIGPQGVTGYLTADRGSGQEREGTRDRAHSGARSWRTCGGKGQFTDDTQMTLWTGEGLLRGHNRWRERGICHIPGVVHRSYQRWLYTQLHPFDDAVFTGHYDPPLDGWLIREPVIWGQRAPGHTCLSALQSADRLTAVNNSKGCGGVMRIAPAGLSPLMDHFNLGCEIAALTHGHPSGYLSAGAFALILSRIMDGDTIEDAVSAALTRLRKADQSDEVVAAIDKTRNLAATTDPGPKGIKECGEGWVAEEALAIALYCGYHSTRRAPDDAFLDGVLLAVNHDGDSDSTGAITGNLLGAMYGLEAVPGELVYSLEGWEVVSRICADMVHHFVQPPPAARFSPNWDLFESYPPPDDLDWYPSY